MAVERSHIYPSSRYAREIDRDNLFISEIMLEDYNCNVPKEIRPIFDTVWNACGWPSSKNYDDEGNWLGRIN